MEEREAMAPQETCPRKSKAEVEQTLIDFSPQNPLVAEMYEVMSQHLGFEKLCMLEVNHCVSAYCALLVSAQHGNILYSGDTIPCINL